VVQVIVIALGIEIRDEEGDIQAFLQKHCDRNGPAPPPGGNNTWFFPAGSGAKATHEIRVVYQMADLAAALDLPKAFVVYEGHSRYGQGPAFGPESVPHLPDLPDKKAFPVNPWGVHFRMGYDATDTECIGDLFAHSVVPAEYDLTTAGSKDFLPGELTDAVKKLNAMKKAVRGRKPADLCRVDDAWRELNVCEPKRAAAKTARGDLPLSGRHFYKKKTKPEEFLTAVKVGSKDLDKATLACSLLFMASCSSKVHFYEPLKRRRKAAKSACTFLLTAEVCSADHGLTFLRQVLLKRRDPTAAKDLERIRRALNHLYDSGNVGIY
jgi:hypothetical protein